MVDVPTREEFNSLSARTSSLEAALAKFQQAPLPMRDPRDFTDLSQWALTFEDDFKVSPLDTGKWKTTFNDGTRTLGGNQERQVYMDASYKGSTNMPLGFDPFSFKQSESALLIKADRTPPNIIAGIWNMPYVSGMISTGSSFFQQYGRFCARMKFPKGKGLWPAFWMLPQKWTWPPELDAVEFFGAPNSRGEGGPMKMHWGFIGGTGGGSWVDLGFDATTAYHTYTIEWEKGVARFYVDDKQVGSGSLSDLFDQPMYMILNLAVGGQWPEDPDSSTQFPAYLAVDFVRAYKRK